MTTIAPPPAEPFAVNSQSVTSAEVMWATRAPPDTELFWVNRQFRMASEENSQ